jgi:hypothetical protein
LALLAPYRAKPWTAAGFLAPTTGRSGDADGLASAPPSGTAAVAPPPGADIAYNDMNSDYSHKPSVDYTPSSEFNALVPMVI